MIGESKKEGDPRNNKITVLLGDENSLEDLIPVELDLRLSAY